MTTEARPLAEYATLTTVFSGALGGFLLLARDRLPERIRFGDMFRIGLASYKIGRLIAEDEVTSWMRARQAAADFLNAAFVRLREA